MTDANGWGRNDGSGSPQPPGPSFQPSAPLPQPSAPAPQPSAPQAPAQATWNGTAGWNAGGSPAAGSWPAQAPAPTAWQGQPQPWPYPAPAPAAPAARPSTARILTLAAGGVSFLPAFPLLTNGVALVAMVHTLENSPASMFIPAFSTIGWLLIAGAVVHGIATIAELVLAARRSAALLFASITALVGAVIAGIGAGMYAVQVENLAQMVSGLGTAAQNEITKARGATAFIIGLVLTLILCHIPGIVYGAQQRRARARAVQARAAAENAEFAAQERRQWDQAQQAAAQQPPGYGQMPYGTLSQPYDGPH